MRLFRSTIFLIIVLLGSPALSQQRNDGLLLWQQLGRPPCDPLIMQLDELAVRLNEKPNLHGYIVVDGGENPVDNVLYERAVTGHFKQRRVVNPDRISVITTRSRGNRTVKIQTWISEDQTKPEVDRVQFTVNSLDRSRRTLFNEDMVQVAQIDGRTTWFGDCTICCLHAFDLAFLAEILKANPDVGAELTIYNKSSKRADRLSKLILDDAVREYRIPRNRLNVKYGGENKRSNSDLKELFDLDVWLAPIGIK